MNHQQESSPEAADDADDDSDARRALVALGNSTWGFNNWNWSVTKQELDFVDSVDGKLEAGAVSFVCVQIDSLSLHRENMGYGTATATKKGTAIMKARKASVTDALRETLDSFGVDTEVRTQIKRLNGLPEKVDEPKNSTANRKDSSDSSADGGRVEPTEPPRVTAPEVRNVSSRHTFHTPHQRRVSNPPRGGRQAATQVRGGRFGGPPAHWTSLLSKTPPRTGFEDRRTAVGGFDAPPKNFATDIRPAAGDRRRSDSERRSREGDADVAVPAGHSIDMNGQWIKPTIFYDGFWTEQNVQKWVAEQTEKSLAAEESAVAAAAAAEAQKRMCYSKV